MAAEAAVDTAVAFGRALRHAGLDVPVGSVTTYVEALGAVGVGRADAVYWAGRTTLVRRPEDIPVYDATFAAFWQDEAMTPAASAEEEVVAIDAGETKGSVEPDEDAPAPALAVRATPRESLRHKDFAAYSPDELSEAKRLMADLRLAGALRRSRRLRPTSRAGSRPDVRRTVRAALRTGGEPLRRPSLQPALRPRPVVLLCDVSGSMEPYTRALLRFVHAAVIGRRRIEAFVFATRLTRITRHLSWRDPDAALARAGMAVADWESGTRLGAVVGEFNTRWRDLARGAVVVVLSDGWDAGEPSDLATEMERLRRRAHRVVWVNPMKASPGYAPLARGMAAALPHVDDFVEGHSLDAMERLVEVIGTP